MNSVYAFGWLFFAGFSHFTFWFFEWGTKADNHTSFMLLCLIGAVFWSAEAIVKAIREGCR